MLLAFQRYIDYNLNHYSFRDSTSKISYLYANSCPFEVIRHILKVFLPQNDSIYVFRHEESHGDVIFRWNIALVCRTTTQRHVKIGLVFGLYLGRFLNQNATHIGFQLRRIHFRCYFYTKNYVDIPNDHAGMHINWHKL